MSHTNSAGGTVVEPVPGAAGKRKAIIAAVLSAVIVGIQVAASLLSDNDWTNEDTAVTLAAILVPLGVFFQRNDMQVVRDAAPGSNRI